MKLKCDSLILRIILPLLIITSINDASIIIDSNNNGKINQWSSEEQFCDNILQPCHCLVDIETNLLSVDCNGEHDDNDGKNFNDILTRIALSIDHIVFDELIIRNFHHIQTINLTKLQRNSIKIIRIFNCTELKQMIYDEDHRNNNNDHNHLNNNNDNDSMNKKSVKQSLSNSLIEIEFANNYAIDSNELFEFLYKFPYLKSIILSSIHYNEMPIFNHTNNNNQCLPWKRLILNHDSCENYESIDDNDDEKNRPKLKILNSNHFRYLCNIQWLDLSCMNIQYINPASIWTLCKYVTENNSKNQLQERTHTHIHIDLSYNHLESLNLDQFINDPNVLIEI